MNSIILTVFLGFHPTGELLASGLAGAECAPQERRIEGPVLEGRIRDAVGRAIPQVRVELWSSGRRSGMVGETWTDSRGIYRFAPCPFGTAVRNRERNRTDHGHALRIYHPRYASADGRNRWLLTVPNIDGRITRRNFSMVPAGGIKARIVAPHSLEPQHLSLRLYNEERTFTRYFTSDSSGVFEQEGLHPGEYLIDVNSGRFRYPLIGKVVVSQNLTTEVSFRYRLPVGDRSK